MILLLEKHFKNKSQDAILVSVKQSSFLLDIVIVPPNLSSGSIFGLGMIVASSPSTSLILNFFTFIFICFIYFFYH